jgi:hypothetical protein
MGVASKILHAGIRDIAALGLLGRTRGIGKEFS